MPNSIDPKDKAARRLSRGLLTGVSLIALAAPAAANPALAIDSLSRAIQGYGGGQIAQGQAASFAVQVAAQANEGGEAGEGGESGERGIDPEDAASNPSDYLIALDVIRAHYLAGQAAYAEGNHHAAGEMFAHPISEIYADLEGVFLDRGVAPFGELMEQASNLALEGKPVAEVNAAVGRVLAALDVAETKAPDDGQPSQQVQNAVLSDLIERAAQQYQSASGEQAGGEAWLDGYGFYRAAAARAALAVPALAKTSPDAAREVESTLAVLKKAFPTAAAPSKLPLDVGVVLSAASAAEFKLSQ